MFRPKQRNQTSAGASSTNSSPSEKPNGSRSLWRALNLPSRCRKAEVKANGADLDPNVRAALDEIAMALGTKVRLYAKSSKSGRLEIEYYSQEDLDRIYGVITKQ